MVEISSRASPRFHPNKEMNEDEDGQNFQLEVKDGSFQSVYYCQPMSALEILRETVRIFRYNSTAFTAIAAVLICPVSGVILSNVLVDQSIVKRLTTRLLLVAKSSGLQLNPFIKQSFYKFSEMVVSNILCFPLYITLSLLSKAAVVHSVDCTYSRKQVDSSKCYAIISKIWKRIVVTYLWVCTVIASCVTLFLVLLLALSSGFSIIGFHPDMILYLAMVMGLVFSVAFANAIIICNIAIVISVLEEVSGPQTLLRSSSLVKGQMQVGLMIFLGSTIGLAFVEGLFQHRVKTLSYGDGSSRIWEGPLLVVMYSFVVLIDSMNNVVFYFSCKSYNLETLNVENQSDLESLVFTSESTGVPQNHTAT